MILYRERRRIGRPADLVARELTERFGEPDTPEAGVREWRYRQLRGLYRYRVALDASEGELDVVVGAPDPLGYLTAAGVVVGALALTVGLPTPALAAALWGYGALALVPVAHLLPGVPAQGPDPAGTETVARRLGATSVPPFLAVGAVLLAGARSSGPTVTAAVASVVGVGIAVYYVAGGLRVDPGLAERRAVPAVGIALSGLVPGVVGLGNGLVATSVVAEAPSRAGIGLALVVVFALDAGALAYCRLALESFRDARIAPPRSRTARTGGVVLFSAANLGLVAGALALAGAVLAAGVGVPLSVPFADLAGATDGLTPPSRWFVGALALAAATPVVLVVVGWLFHLLRTTAGALRGLWAAEPLDSPAGVDAAVRVADLGVPIARPVRLPGRRFVLVDRSLVDALDDDELAAVLAHEAYHLRDRDPGTSLLIALRSLAVGGRNAALAFVDYAAIERRADDYAADRVGVDPLVRSLRRMEALRYEAGVGSPDRDRNRRQLAVDTLLGPYRLLFGPVVLDAAHDGVDERIDRLVEG